MQHKTISCSQFHQQLFRYVLRVKNTIQTVSREKLPKTLAYEKASAKKLMKLTPVPQGKAKIQGKA